MCVCDRQALFWLTAGRRPTKVDADVKDVVPVGATILYASPEVLRSLQRQLFDVADDYEGVLINGPAADIWGFGCVCYELLTGDLPFLPEATPAHQAPATVSQELIPSWEEYQSMLEEYTVWVRVALCRCL